MFHYPFFLCPSARIDTHTHAHDERIIAVHMERLKRVAVIGMDDLKAVRTLRGHQGPVTDVHLMNGMPLSSSEDGTICIWDPEQSSPVVSLETDSKVNAMAVDEMQGRLTSAGWSLDVWDIATAQRVLQLSSLFGGDDDDGGDELLFEMMEG
jgi:WD40 repeat protein